MPVETIHQLLQQRNAYETDPYVQVYTSIDKLRKKCQGLEQECCNQESDIAKVGTLGSNSLIPCNSIPFHSSLLKPSLLQLYSYTYCMAHTLVHFFLILLVHEHVSVADGTSQ